jgi:glycerophosphoryl diester phosphodiesterase
MTADREIVLFHDNVVNVDGHEVPVAAMDYDSLRRVHPTVEGFSEFLQSILSATTPDMNLTFVVDAKTDHRDQGFADAIICTLREIEVMCANASFANASFVITSFDHRLIGEIQSHDSPYECGLIIHHVPTAAEIETYTCNWVGLDTHTLTGTVVADAHSAGKKVFAYTPNDAMEFDRCVAMGVDGVYTDDVQLYIDHNNNG